MDIYDIRQMQEDLTELKAQLTANEKTVIAGAEHCSTVTVQNYLNMKITVPALAAAIIKRGKALLKERG